MKNNKRQVLILLPGKESGPIGGFKVAYQYADHLAEKYDVHIVYCHIFLTLVKEKFSLLLLPKRIKRFFGFYIKRALKIYHPGEWFNFKNKVSKDFVYKFNDFAFRHYKKDSIVFATAIATAYALKDLKNFDRKNCFYLIQDYEKWGSVTDEEVLNSYKFGFNNIVISDGLEKIVKSTGASCFKIYNGFDSKEFYLTTKIEERSKYEIAMLNHNDDRKRCVDSFKALEIVKQKYPELHVNIFGVPDRPDFLPDWYTYYKTPDKKTHNELYNKSAIFVAASKMEGFGLPPAEAMQCGCAVCCTNIEGFKTYAKDGETALMSPVFNPQALAQNIIKLIENDELRIKIAKASNENIKQFSMDNVYNLLDNLMKQLSL